MIEDRKPGTAKARRRGGRISGFVFAAALTVLPLLGAAPAHAIDEIDAGPKIGTNIADLISAPDQNGACLSG